jgi:hypothetical protein
MKRDRDILGEFAVYPGHPATLALCITEHFSSWDEAFKATVHGFPEALGRNEIPGAGGNVYAALDMLVMLRSGSSFSEAMAWADNYWARCDANAATRAERWTKGQEQADRFKDRLAAQSAWWTVK